MSPPPIAPASPRPAPRREISRRWFIVTGVVWLVVIAAAGVWGLTHPSVTDREQTTVAQAKPFVDEAIARVADAVTANDAGVVAVSGFERVGPCDVSVFRGGERWRRSLVAVVPPGQELGALDRVAAALPPSYHPSVRRGEAPRLTADAGYWVLLGGTVSAPGEVTFVADTGDCRPLGGAFSEDFTPNATAWGVGMLASLGLTAQSATDARVSCLDGGAIGTNEVRTGRYAGNLASALRDQPDAARIVVAEPRLFAFVIDMDQLVVQVAVRAHEDETILTATTLCQ